MERLPSSPVAFEMPSMTQPTVPNPPLLSPLGRSGSKVPRTLQEDGRGCPSADPFSGCLPPPGERQPVESSTFQVLLRRLGEEHEREIVSLHERFYDYYRTTLKRAGHPFDDGVLSFGFGNYHRGPLDGDLAGEGLVSCKMFAEDSGCDSSFLRHTGVAWQGCPVNEGVLPPPRAALDNFHDEKTPLSFDIDDEVGMVSAVQRNSMLRVGKHRGNNAQATPAVVCGFDAETPPEPRPQQPFQACHLPLSLSLGNCRKSVTNVSGTGDSVLSDKKVILVAAGCQLENEETHGKSAGRVLQSLSSQVSFDLASDDMSKASGSVYIDGKISARAQATLRASSANVDPSLEPGGSLPGTPRSEMGDKKKCGRISKLCERWASLAFRVLDMVNEDFRWPRRVWSEVVAANPTQLMMTHKRVKSSMMPRARGSSGSKMNPRSSRAGLVLPGFAAPAVDNGWRPVCPEKIVLDPYSKQKLYWSMLGMAFIFYDLIFMPMHAFNMELETGFFAQQKLAALFYWTIDIGLTFLTAVHVKRRQTLETRLREIARHYMFGWLLFDLLVVLPGWAELILDMDSALSHTRSLKYLRMMRFMRLIRVAKLEHLLREALQAINSPSLLVCVQITKLMFGLVLLNHLVACCWFWLGTLSTASWVYTKKTESKSVLYKYLTAMHWSLTQFQGTSEVVPNTTSERAYAVTFLLFALIILASFLSSLTNNMRQLQDIHHEKTSLTRAVRVYLSMHGVSASLSVRVKRYVEWQSRMKERSEQNEQVLSFLPLGLLMDLQEELRVPIINNHHFFSGFRTFFPRIVRRLCYEAFTQLQPAPGESIFTPTDQATSMYFIATGVTRYIARTKHVHVATRTAQFQRGKPSDSLGKASSLGKFPQNDSILVIDEDIFEDDDMEEDLGESQGRLPADLDYQIVLEGWVAEPVLWAEHWEHCGDLHNGEHGSTLLGLISANFVTMVSGHISAQLTAALYARQFVACLNSFGRQFTDVIDNRALFEMNL